MWSGSTTTPGLRRLSTGIRALQSASVWLMLQQTVAAVLAWLIATNVAGHEEPFFAPMSAVIALNATLGERGRNAVRMLLGVIVGISVGELTIALLGRGYGRLAIATFMAMALARVMNANRIVIAQAAASAILTVAALQGGQVGFDRLIDASIGGAIALVFTQVLFAPEPVRLLRRAESAELAALATLLDRTADALECNDTALTERTQRHMQHVRTQLVEVEHMRAASSSVHRHTVTWHPATRAAAVEQERARARHLDFLGDSCLLLARTALVTSAGDRHVVAPSIREMSRAIADLAPNLEDHDARERAATLALELARTLFRTGEQPQSYVGLSRMLLEVVAVDFLTFIGIPREDAITAIRKPAGELDLEAIYEDAENTT